MSNAIGYGRQFAGFYDRIFPSGPEVDQTVAWLAGHHPGGGTLELGVGTGRIALPLAERVGEVVGVDASPDMLAVLRQSLADHVRPVIPVLGDLRDYCDERTYGLVYCVCGTLSMLLDPADQAAALVTAAKRLAPGGLVVVETHNPVAVTGQLHRQGPRESFLVPYALPGSGLLTYSTLDPANQIWHLAHVWIADGRASVAQELSRLTTAEEVDGYAAAAGLVPRGRYGNWAGAPFTGAEPTYICVYGRADETGTPAG